MGLARVELGRGGLGVGRVCGPGVVSWQRGHVAGGWECSRAAAPGGFSLLSGLHCLVLLALLTFVLQGHTKRAAQHIHRF